MFRRNRKVCHLVLVVVVVVLVVADDVVDVQSDVAVIFSFLLRLLVQVVDSAESDENI